jgi:propanol-preferring alcohol dehydrogenase
MRLPVPVAGPGEILIRLEASGVCHTDVHVWQGESLAASRPDPFILGHEGVGRVTGLGPGVTGWALGERAGAAWLYGTCGQCAACTAGQESFCHRQKAHGYDVPGTFADYVVTRADHAARLPEGDAADLAPLMCAGLTAFGALERAGLGQGETCAIFGCGGLGLYAVQLAARRGARVVAVDSDPAKLALARSLGAAGAALATPDLAGTWPEADRAHVTVNFAPTPRTWPAMRAATRPLGRIIAAAMVDDPVPLSQTWLTWSGITLTGTSVGTRAQMRALMALHAAAPLRGAIETIPLEGVTEALTALSEGRAKGRYCIRF